MRRWLVLSLGLGIAAVAGYALLTASAPPPGGAAGSHDDHGAEAHGEIGSESRQQLREILRKADSEEDRKR